MKEVKEWIGVDLDRTLAHYDIWRGELHIGEIIEPMAARVRQWLAEGKEVRIFTARVSKTSRSRDTSTVEEVRKVIQDWTEQHFGVRLEVTCEKDSNMIQLWDDRAVQVVPNTGQIVNELQDETKEPWASIKYLLDDCPSAVRVKYKGLDEDLLGSLCVTFMALKNKHE